MPCGSLSGPYGPSEPSSGSRSSSNISPEQSKAWLDYDVVDRHSLPITTPHLRLDPGSVGRSQSGQSYHARYNESEENIFLQLQKQNFSELLNSFRAAGISFVNYDVFPIYHQLGIPDSDPTPYIEPRYVRYLLQEVPDTLGAGQLFPWVFEKIYAYSVNHVGLRYTMLAVASFLADNKNNRPPLYAFKYLQMGIPLIQQALTDEIINDALIYAVFFAAYLHFLCGELASTRRHLEGLHLLLERYQTPPTSPDPHAAVITPPAELMFIWRMAIRMDHTWAVGDQNLVFPLVPKQDELHREWVIQLVEGEGEKVEWALAQFALDDLFTRAIALNKKAVILRSQNGYDAEIVEAAIELETGKLKEEHQAWNERLCVEAAREQTHGEGSCYDNSDGEVSTNFLHYPALNIANKVYGANLIQYYWVLIYITFVSHPNPGPSPYKRFETAILLCRTYAAVGWTKTVGVCGMVLGLYLAGLTLSEPMYPTEFAWIAEQFERLDRECGSRIGVTVLNILRTTWRSDGSPWKHYIAGNNR